jgi:hypothetical protein
MVLKDNSDNIEQNQPNIYEKWEEKFRCWSQPPSKDIQRKFGKQIRILRSCMLRSISDRERLGLDKDIMEVSFQGSYGGSINIERSDIDIGIRLVYEPISCDSQNINSILHLSQFDHWKSKLCKLNELVEKLLIRRFGKENVERSPWGYFKVHEQHSGVTIEVLPAIVRGGEVQEWMTDDGELISDAFKQVDANRTRKHNMTGKRFRKVVRILKRILYEMKDSNTEKYNSITSHLIESVIYNAPNSIFSHEKITDDIRGILEYGILSTHDDKGCEEWKRLDGKNYAFRGPRCWDRQEIHDFLVDIWNYIGFGDIEHIECN